MNAVKTITIAGLGWFPIIALALWWAGFAPFPTAPLYLSYTRTVLCDWDDPEGHHCSSATLLNGHYDHYHFSGDAPPKSGHCEFTKGGDNYPEWNCDDLVTVPRFGLGHARWVIETTAITSPERDKPEPAKGTTGLYVYFKAAYSSYGACMYRMPKDTIPAESGEPNTVWWEYSKCKSVKEYRP